MDKPFGGTFLNHRSGDMPLILPAVRQVSVENRADSRDAARRVGVRRKGSKTLEVPGVPQVEVSNPKSDCALTQSRQSRKGSKDLQILQKLYSGSSETGLLETARSCDRSETAFSQTARNWQAVGVVTAARRWQGSRKGSKDLQVPQERHVVNSETGSETARSRTCSERSETAFSQTARNWQGKRQGSRCLVNRMGSNRSQGSGETVETGLPETATRRCSPDVSVPTVPSRTSGYRRTCSGQDVSVPRVPSRIPSYRRTCSGPDVSVPSVPSRIPSYRRTCSGPDVSVPSVPSRTPSYRMNHSDCGETALQEKAMSREVSDYLPEVVGIISVSRSQGIETETGVPWSGRVSDYLPEVVGIISVNRSEGIETETGVPWSGRVSHDLPEMACIISVQASECSETETGVPWSGRVSHDPPEMACIISVQPGEGSEIGLPETATRRKCSPDVAVPEVKRDRRLFRRSNCSTDLSQPSTSRHRRDRIKTSVTKPKTASVAELAQARSRDFIEAWFKSWDLDGSGKIDQHEFKRILNNLSLAWDEEEFMAMMESIDSNHDGEVDLKEFADWVTDPSSTKTVSLDGWLGKVNLAELLQPLFVCFNQSGNDGFISKDDFLRAYQITTYCLKIHPDGKDELHHRNAEEEFYAADKDSTQAITFHEFTDWQELLLKDSGIPNSHLPRLVEELAEALTIVLDVLNWDEKGMPINRSDNVLQSSTEKLAALSRELYAANKQLLLQSFQTDEVVVEEVDPDCGPNHSWCPLPQNALQVLLRKCAEENGLLVPSSQTPHPPSHAPPVSSSSAPSRRELFNMARRSTSLRHCDSLAFGQVMLISPDSDRRQSEPASRWYAWLARSNKEGRKDDLFYVLETSHGNLVWNRCGGSQIEQKFKAQPSDLQLFALLATQRLVSLSSTEDQLCWERVQEALTNAVGMNVISEEGLLSYNSSFRAQAKQNLFENNEIHELLEMSDPSKRLADAVTLHLEELKLSPHEVIAGLAEMEVLAVSEEAWAQIAQHELEFSLQCS
ncbi:unnamed protein product [Polarella glacialis]|uniref:EF-hand domain-containing protein n=1 Tax=Polarella glacialis TaxID=89957 RepID=A0A813DU38_POLGL|nr:unnamed protein product [Polarella glacialis]